MHETVHPFLREVLLFGFSSIHGRNAENIEKKRGEKTWQRIMTQ